MNSWGTTLLTVDSFHMKFCRSIQVMFNWRRFFTEKWPIKCVTLTTQDELTHLRLPWYRNKHGKFVEYNTENATPVMLDNICEWHQLLSSLAVTKIDQIKEDYLQGTQVPQFEFPSYALPDNMYMVLDANHRLCALTLAKVQFSLNMWVVEGPIDPTALADTTFLSSIKLK